MLGLAVWQARRRCLSAALRRALLKEAARCPNRVCEAEGTGLVKPGLTLASAPKRQDAVIWVTRARRPLPLKGLPPLAV